MRTAALSAGIESGSKRRSERTWLLVGSFERTLALNERRSTDDCILVQDWSAFNIGRAKQEWLPTRG